MTDDAQTILNKLVNYHQQPNHKQASTASGSTNASVCLDPAVVFNAALKKYCQACCTTRTQPTLSEIHDIELAVCEMVKEKKRRDRNKNDVALLLRVRMRSQVTSLAVALWVASCETPYMSTHRRGSDSFRPFVAGVFYGLKRGVSLTDGTVVLPACPTLASSLPTLRATAANSAAKALHASSHRGLCTLHRSISSCTHADAADLYELCARQAQVLAADVRAGNFDL